MAPAEMHEFDKERALEEMIKILEEEGYTVLKGKGCNKCHKDNRFK